MPARGLPPTGHAALCRPRSELRVEPLHPANRAQIALTPHYQAELNRDAEEKFLSEHVTPYLPRFAERLATAAPEGGHHAALARILMQIG